MGQTVYTSDSQNGCYHFPEGTGKICGRVDQNGSSRRHGSQQNENFFDMVCESRGQQPKSLRTTSLHCTMFSFIKRKGKKKAKGKHTRSYKTVPHPITGEKKKAAKSNTKLCYIQLLKKSKVEHTQTYTTVLHLITSPQLHIVFHVTL